MTPPNDSWHRPNPIAEPDNHKIKCLRCGMWCTPQGMHHCSATGKIVLAPA